MGTSRPFYLSEFCNLILEKQPKTVLDIGPGFGKNGFLVREFTDIWNHRYSKESWRTKIDCIEIFPEYLNNTHRHIYNNVFIGNAYSVIDNLEDYDLIIATDIIEHFERTQAEEMMHKIINKSKNYYITIPKNVGNRGGMSQIGTSFNKYEAHISGEWSQEQLNQFGDCHLFNNWTWRIKKETK
jgi:hypothetical protein